MLLWRGGRGVWDTRDVADIRTILCPVDFSEGSRRALDYAGLLARRCDAELIVLHAVEDAPLFTTYGPIPDLSVKGELESNTQRDLLALAAGTEIESGKIRTEVIHGPSSKAILQYAEQQRVDLIVMASHGRSGLEHAIFGSVTERVVRRAPCPVLIVRPRQNLSAVPEK